MHKLADLTGVILAGGRSSRFGSNKALACLRSVALIESVVVAMRSVFTDLLIVTNTPHEYAHLELPMVQDHQPYHGPMGGIVTAFRHSPHDNLFVVACDMPLIDAKIIREVVRRGFGFDAAVPVHDGLHEYLMALYSRRLVRAMERALEQGERSLKRFLVTVTDLLRIPVEGDSWRNVNTRQDLEALEDRHAG